MLAAVGDVTGDGLPDLVGQPKGGAMQVYAGQGLALGGEFAAAAAVPGKKLIPVGRWNKDRVPGRARAHRPGADLYSGITRAVGARPRHSSPRRRLRLGTWPA